ncbi:MAG: YafY family transcriptional regulator [Holophagaceae bacterium]|nr:YafY family transcriptional regulator [Holophagaceae bacterium]
MRRADRLFQIVQILRRDRLTTAARLADELGISRRTLYRDVSDLQASGVPIEGEAGTGYRLPRHFDLPPMMFTVDEAEAIFLGLNIASAWADPALAEAATTARRKLKAGLTEGLREALKDSVLEAPDFHVAEAHKAPLGDLRRAVRDRLRVRLTYEDREGQTTTRLLRPLGLYFWGGAWTLSAWCEVRQDFRTFRVDRFKSWETDAPFPREAGRELEDFLAKARKE